MSKININIESHNSSNQTVKIDLGFWNSKGEYIEDIQEVPEEELKE